MKETVPLYFLIGVTRLIAVYFALRSLDSLGGLAMSYQLQTAMAPEIAQGMPGVWSLYLPTMAIYLGLVAAVWFLAPGICRLSMKNFQPGDGEEGSGVSWNESLIFMTGALVTGWGLARFSEVLVPIFKTNAQQHPQSGLALSDLTGLFATFLLLGFGIIFMARFRRIHDWMKRRGGG